MLYPSLATFRYLCPLRHILFSIIISIFLFVISSTLFVIPSSPFVITVSPFVIPAEAGIHPFFFRHSRIPLVIIASFPCHSRVHRESILFVIPTQVEIQRIRIDPRFREGDGKEKERR